MSPTTSSSTSSRSAGEVICLADLTGKLYNNKRICRLERCGETMYSLKNRAFAGVLALLMLLSMTGLCRDNLRGGILRQHYYTGGI